LRIVEDALERNVAVPETPARIVSLAPSLTEAIVAAGAGARLVGVTREADAPADVARVGRAGWIQVPRVAALGPDLVLGVRHEHRSGELAALKAQNLPLYIAEVESVEDAVALVGEVGDLVDGEAARIEAAAAAARAGVEHARTFASGGAPVPVFLATWREPWITVEPDGYLADALAACGAEPVPAGRPHRRGRRVTLDDVARARPRRILVPDAHPFDARAMAALAPLAPVARVPPRLLRYGVATAHLPSLAALIHA
jgi:iron complex transport system substrate-binding protein